MSRKARFPRNRKEAKVRVQRLHARIRNGRRDVLHKTTISKNHAMVCIEDLEDLKVKNMSKSTAGSTEQPGNEKRRPRVFSGVAKMECAAFHGVRCGPVVVLRIGPVMLTL